MSPLTLCLCLLTTIYPVQNSFLRAFQLQSIPLRAMCDTKMNLFKGFPSSRGDKIYREYKIKMSKARKKQQSSMRVWMKTVLATGHLIWGSDIWEGLCRTSENWTWDVQAAGTTVSGSREVGHGSSGAKNGKVFNWMMFRIEKQKMKRREKEGGEGEEEVGEREGNWW